MAETRLALFGGTPVCTDGWPTWPMPTRDTVRMLEDVAASGRWAISGTFTGHQCYEKQFSQAFARYQDVPYAVPTANGTAALTIALEALNIGVGDEVLVPGLTWVACASATAGIGAVPILVDVEPDTLCMSLEAARAAITERTAAILLVHAYCSCADIDGFMRLSQETGIPLIEDCSQAHGAEWRGQKVGTFGHIGAFSLQQVKVLTCGEGGIAITRSADVYDRMQQLRADGRRYIEGPQIGQLELEEVGSVQGRNYCMSEFHAAVALSQLPLLDEQNALRERNAEYLSRLLEQIPGLSTIAVPHNVTRRTYFQYLVRLDPKVLGPFSTLHIIEALTAELNVYIEMIDVPLSVNRLYNPVVSPRLPKTKETQRLFIPSRFELPVAIEAQQNCVAFGHWALLGSQEHMVAIAEAFKKVISNLHLLADTAS